MTMVNTVKHAHLLREIKPVDWISDCSSTKLSESSPFLVLHQVKCLIRVNCHKLFHRHQHRNILAHHQQVNLP